jgi:hypothetical protein
MISIIIRLGYTDILNCCKIFQLWIQKFIFNVANNVQQPAALLNRTNFGGKKMAHQG